MKIFVSSYAAAPPSSPWNRADEKSLFDGLAGFGLAGLEIPFYTDRLHLHDDSWLISQIRPDWRLILTCLPGTMAHLKKDRDFGLASVDDDGRRRALDFAESARRAVERLNQDLGRSAVAAISLHSAPRRDADADDDASRDAFIDSLSDLRRRNWHGAELLVEHCDAAVPDQTPDKGFLDLEDECAALDFCDGSAPARLLLNWGRSAVETRSAEGVLTHARLARRSGRLAGLFFSGATPNHPLYGAWKDSHAPFSTSCAASILTLDAAKAALAEAGELAYLGLKIQPLPENIAVPERLALVKDGLAALKIG